MGGKLEGGSFKRHGRKRKTMGVLQLQATGATMGTKCSRGYQNIGKILESIAEIR